MLGYIISFFLGVIVTLIYKRLQFKEQPQPEIKVQKPEIKNPKLVCIDKMFQELNTNGTLPIKLSASVLSGLKQIAQTPEWYKKIDKETTENLYKIYQKWQAHLKGANKDLTNVSEGGGFHRIKFWEGTKAELQEAINTGIVDEYTHITVTDEEYHGSYISMDADGQIEEYME